MKIKYINPIIQIFAIVCLIFFAYSSVIADDKTPAKKSDSKTIVYKPPMRGAPANRMGGGTRGLTRGLENELPVLNVLAPNHTGLTLQSQPVLYWYISAPSSKRIVFTLNDEDKRETLFQTDLSNIRNKGIQRLNLADYELSIESEKEYSWSVTIIADQNQPSNDIFSGGNIRRIKPLKPLSEKLEKTADKDIPAIYAEEGIWYDAISSLSQLIESNPENRHFHKQRAELLEQIGLYQAAEYDKSASQ